MITDSLTYLRTGDDWLKTVLVGGLLTLLGFLVVPAVLVAGYLVRVLRATMHGDDAPPRFDDWGAMAAEGVRAFGIALVYGVLPALLLAATAAVGGLAASGGRTLALLGGGLVLLGGLLALALGLVAAYVLPAALANYAEQDRFGAGFALADLRPVLGSGTYATAWLSGVAVVLVAGLVAGLLNAVPLLGTVVGGFVSFYAVTAAYYIVGHAWGDLRGLALDEADGDDEAGAERPAV
jgi:hypothetical protein